ncbi:MAG: Bax inhibitor-1/YccA family protein [Fluviibacter sp.]|jgi:modulator of FtsH protease|nr:Bax inhibitor-1/YccA family protein [Rhodocyclales bacterium]
MDVRSTSSYSGVTINAGRNQVLRNTYWLLALSLIPTVIGAVVGLSSGVPMLMAGSPIMGMLVFFGIAFGLMWAIQRNKDSGAGVLLLLAFTFFMGVMLSQILSVALGMSHGGELIAMAGSATAAIFFSLAMYTSVSKRDFSFMGNFLFAGLILLILASIANIFLAIPAMAIAISAIGALLFTGYLLFDLSRIVNGGETNYITATLAVYLDIYNLFVSLLNLLMIFTGNDRD